MITAVDFINLRSGLKPWAELSAEDREVVRAEYPDECEEFWWKVDGGHVVQCFNPKFRESL